MCQYQYQRQSENAVPGAFVPRCKPDGSYDDVQCRGSVCYCVDRRGHELQGTRVSMGQGSPVCATPGMFINLFACWLCDPFMKKKTSSSRLFAYLQICLEFSKIIEHFPPQICWPPVGGLSDNWQGLNEYKHPSDNRKVLKENRGILVLTCFGYIHPTAFFCLHVLLLFSPIYLTFESAFCIFSPMFYMRKYM